MNSSPKNLFDSSDSNRNAEELKYAQKATFNEVFHLEQGGAIGRNVDRLRDLRDAQPQQKQRRPDLPCVNGRLPRGSARRKRRRRLVGHHGSDRENRSTPTVSSSSARTFWAAAAGPPGPTRSIRKQANLTGPIFRRSRFATWSQRKKN